MSLFKSRVVAVVAATAVIGAATTTGAVAAKVITGDDIKNGTITTKDVKNNSLKSSDIKNGSLAYKDLNDKAKTKLAGQDGKDGVFAPYTDALESRTTITKIGGSIDANNTPLDTGFDLPAGTYVINVSGSFISDQAASTDVATYPQLSLWLDKSGDGKFQWKGADGDETNVADNEGSISPNALMPMAANRHISVSGQTVVTLEEDTYVGLFGFGYGADQGSKRSGEIDVLDAVITATPISTN